MFGIVYFTLYIFVFFMLNLSIITLVVIVVVVVVVSAQTFPATTDQSPEPALLCRASVAKVTRRP